MFPFPIRTAWRAASRAYLSRPWAMIGDALILAFLAGVVAGAVYF